MGGRWGHSRGTRIAEEQHRGHSYPPPSLGGSTPISERGEESLPELRMLLRSNRRYRGGGDPLLPPSRWVDRLSAPTLHHSYPPLYLGRERRQSSQRLS